MLGTFIARAFSQGGWDVVRAGRRSESAPDFLRLDLEDAAALSRACAEADVVVNTAAHPGLAPQRVVLRQGGILVDLIELPSAERARLVEGEPGAPGLVVTDTGLGGVGYLALTDLISRHPQADRAEYSLMFSASGSTGRAGALFAHRLLADAPQHRSAQLPLPRPAGPRRCLEVGGDDSGLLRQTVGDVPVRHYLCMQPRALHGALLALNRLRLLSRLPAAAFTAGAGKAPADPSDEEVCDWVAVGAGGRRLAARSVEGRGYYRLTAAATLAFADALAGSVDGKRGLLSIDELVTLDAVRPALEAQGIAIHDHPVGQGEGRPT